MQGPYGNFHMLHDLEDCWLGLWDMDGPARLAMLLSAIFQVKVQTIRRLWWMVGITIDRNRLTSSGILRRASWTLQMAPAFCDLTDLGVVLDTLCKF